MAALLLLIATPALAAEKPVTRPTRDVDVTYRAEVGGKPMQQRIRVAAAAGKTRIDTPSPGLYMLVNRGAGTMDMVSDGDRGVIQLPYDPARVGGAPEGAAYQRIGTDVVAGLSCTEWRTTDTAGHAVTACFTADGVLLRARAGTHILVQAASVAYGPLDPAIFAVPAGYQRTSAPVPK